MYDDDEPDPALGLVLESGRGALPFALIHGESLVACAAWALGQAGIRAVDSGTLWVDVQGAELALVLHDPLCPMTPPEFLADCVARSADTGQVVVGVRPVTDTVKRVVDGVVGATVDRSTLHAVVSPIVLPPAVVRDLPAAPEGDFAALVTALASDHAVVWAEAPSTARRVAHLDDLRVLEALTAGEGPG